MFIKVIQNSIFRLGPFLTNFENMFMSLYTETEPVTNMYTETDTYTQTGRQTYKELNARNLNILLPMIKNTNVSPTECYEFAYYMDIKFLGICFGTVHLHRQQSCFCLGLVELLLYCSVGKKLMERLWKINQLTCTSVICEPSARRIFSVFVGYGLSRCLYSHCFKGRAMSCRACRLCRTFPGF